MGFSHWFVSLGSLLVTAAERLGVSTVSISGLVLNFDKGLSWPPSRLLKDLSILVSDGSVAVPLSLWKNTAQRKQNTHTHPQKAGVRIEQKNPRWHSTSLCQNRQLPAQTSTITTWKPKQHNRRARTDGLRHAWALGNGRDRTTRHPNLADQFSCARDGERERGKVTLKLCLLAHEVKVGWLPTCTYHQRTTVHIERDEGQHSNKLKREREREFEKKMPC